MSVNENTEAGTGDQLRFTASEWITHRTHLANLIEDELGAGTTGSDVARNIAETFLYNDLVRIDKLNDIAAEKITILTMTGRPIRERQTRGEDTLCEDTSCAVIRPHQHGNECTDSCGCHDNLGGH